MSTIYQLPVGYKIVIPCQYYSGRRADVRVIEGGENIIHISIHDCRPYQNYLDGLLQIDIDALPDYSDTEKAIKVIKQICINYYAQKLIVLSDDEEYHAKRRYGEDAITPLKAYLGGTWSSFFAPDEKWIDEAKKRKGGEIYLM